MNKMIPPLTCGIGGVYRELHNGTKNVVLYQSFTHTLQEYFTVAEATGLS